MKNPLKTKEEDKMTKDNKAHVEPHPEQYEAETTAPASLEEMYAEERGKKTDDAEKVAAWEAAAQAAPSADEAATLRAKVAEVEAMLEKVSEEYARAAVTRACAFGFQRVAGECDVTPKQIHTWKQRFLPDLPDLSAVPDREARREERRVAALDARLAAEKQLREKREAAAARLAALRTLNEK